MPEQLTRHPEVTLQVLGSAGAKCGQGEQQQILKQCPAERFCKLPGGEICVYGLPEAHRMTQIGAAQWRSLAPPGEAPLPAAPQGPVASELPAQAAVGLVSLAIGIALGAAWMRRRRR